MIKLVVLIFFILGSQYLLGQPIKKSVSFKVIQFEDSITVEGKDNIKIKLINTSDTIIRVSNRFTYNIIVVSVSNPRLDTFDLNEVLKHADINFIQREEFIKLKPGDETEFLCTFYNAVAMKGIIKVKFVLNLNYWNKNFNNPETQWIQFYYNCKD